MIVGPVEVMIGLAAIFVIAFSKGAFGGGLAVVGIPILTFVMDPIDAALVIGPLLPLMDLMTLGVYPPRTWSKPDMLWILPGVFAGLAVGTLIFAVIPVEALRFVIGAAILAYSIRQLIRRRAPPATPLPVSPPLALFWGMIGGITTFIANAGQPPVAAYLIRRGLGKTVFAGTMSAIFTVSNLVRLPMLGILGLERTHLLAFLAMMLPAIPAGVLAGKALHDRLDRDRLFFWVYLLLGLAGAKLIAEGAGAALRAVS